MYLLFLHYCYLLTRRLNRNIHIPLNSSLGVAILGMILSPPAALMQHASNSHLISSIGFIWVSIPGIPVPDPNGAQASLYLGANNILTFCYSASGGLVVVVPHNWLGCPSYMWHHRTPSSPPRRVGKAQVSQPFGLFVFIFVVMLSLFWWQVVDQKKTDRVKKWRWKLCY